MNKGRVFLIPTLLGSENWEYVIPSEVVEITRSIRFFAVENIKTARRYLRKIIPDFPIDDATFLILNKRTGINELSSLIKPAQNGFNVGIISEAGCPGIADPGADLIAFAHQHEIEVVPLVGPSSILLGLIGSGFNGQSFSFHGYIPKDRGERIATLKKYESKVNQTGETQIFMDTPFRNDHLLEDILSTCNEHTLLCIASNLTLPNQLIQSKKIAIWKKDKLPLNKQPTIFLLGKFF